MGISNKFTISSIVIPHASITGIPQGYTSSDTKISFELIKPNELSATFDFCNSDFDKSEAIEFARSETYQIAHTIALQYKLHTECTPCHSGSWGDSSSSERSCSITGMASIALPVDIKIKSVEALNGYEVALDFFNQALYYNEKSGKDKEVAYWIYFSLEALQIILYGRSDKHKLKSELIKANLFPKDQITAFNNTIGSYFRHYKSSYGGKILGIRECVDTYQKILDYFVNRQKSF